LGRDAKAVSVSQISFLAEASDDAVLGAARAGMRIGAVRGASGAAGVEFLVGRASGDGVDRSQLHRWFDLGALGSQDAAAVFADVIFLAGAAGDADERAGDESVFAGTITAFAFAVFFVVAALLLGWHHHGFQRVDVGGAFAG